eukprot:scaffold130772_cov46-Prasinocladus_malaysianus.AAC.1
MFNPGWDGSMSWAEMTGQDFVRNNGIKDIDYCSVHMWYVISCIHCILDDLEYIWGKRPDDWGLPLGDMDFLRGWLTSHVEDATKLNKPFVLEEFGKKKDAAQPQSIREPYYDLVYSEALDDIGQNKNFAGLLFWEWDSTTDDITQTPVERPYGVKETDFTWTNYIEPHSEELAAIMYSRSAAAANESKTDHSGSLLLWILVWTFRTTANCCWPRRYVSSDYYCNQIIGNLRIDNAYCMIITTHTEKCPSHPRLYPASKSLHDVGVCPSDGLHPHY